MRDELDKKMAQDDAPQPACGRGCGAYGWRGVGVDSYASHR